VLNSRLSWGLLTALWVLAALAGVLPAMMSPMMFDAPGSSTNPLTIVFALLVATFPLVCIAGAVLPWILRRWRFAKWLFVLPLLHLGIAAVFMLALDRFCGGQFACGQLG
jgi:hypothetical protein